MCELKYFWKKYFIHLLTCVESDRPEFSSGVTLHFACKGGGGGGGGGGGESLSS